MVWKSLLNGPLGTVCLKFSLAQSERIDQRGENIDDKMT